VKLLVTGPHVAVCEGCAALAMAIATTLLERQGKTDEWLRLVVDALPPKCPYEISRPMLEALLKETAEPSLIRQVASIAGKLHNHPLVVELLQRIPEPDRTASDWHFLGYALGENGHDVEGLAAASKALALDDGKLRPWCLDNTVWFACRLERQPSNEQKARWLADLEEAKHLLTTQHPPGWEVVLQGCFGTEAALYHATGDNTRALQALTAAEKVAPLSGYQLLIRARVLASSGLSTRAREEAERALQDLHPQSHKADEARALLASLP
jgi:tetratricopeptide (TPR) repeat protein